MTSQTSHPAQDIDLTLAWGVDLETAVCEHCDWSYLLPQGSLPLNCPHCFQKALNSLEGEIHNLTYTHPPELVVPFNISADRLAQSIENFAIDIWFAPQDLKPQTLQARLHQLYLPMWLVDSKVQATWQAEVGFNYEAISHQDRFDQNRGGWSSQQVTETRTRWEPRVGRLTRAYHNISAPALEEHRQLERKLGSFDLKAAQPYQAATLAQVLVRLPNRSAADAWPEAIPTIRATAAEECRRACQADYMRDFRWTTENHNRNWTLLLLPVYTTYYLDDDHNPEPILIHGQTGRLSGPRRASMKRAQRAALFIVIAATVIFMLSLIAAITSLFLPHLFLIAGFGVIASIIIGLVAPVPIAIAWQFNRAKINHYML